MIRIVGDEAVAVKLSEFLFVSISNGGESRECSLEMQSETAGPSSFNWRMQKESKTLENRFSL